MKFVLSQSDFEFLKKNIPYAYEMISDISNENSTISFEVEDVSEFQGEITSEIVDSGMDDEDTVNDNGKRMYRIYDELLLQKRKLSV